MKQLTRVGSKGDTIIEILLSIAVLSMVLSVSYGLANRSSQANRQAQERGEAQKLAEEQLELLRGTVSLDNPWEDQCFNTSGVPTSTAAECNGRGPGGLYDVSVFPTGENTFTAEVRWDNIRGALDRDTLSLAYKLPVTGDIPETDHYDCSDGIDNDGDGLIDHVSVNPSNPDPDCTSATGDTEITPLPDPILSVVVKKIPQGPGNTTPSCSNSATQNKPGSTVRLQNATTNLIRSASGTPPTATFANLDENTAYTATVTAPSNYGVCPSGASTGSQATTTGVNGTTGQLDFKIRPNCGPAIVGYNNYWAYGNRRTDLDGYYVTLNGSWPTWNTSFIAGNVRAGGTFWYVFSGDVNWGGGYAYYWLWEAIWHSDPIYGNVCPS